MLIIFIFVYHLCKNNAVPYPKNFDRSFMLSFSQDALNSESKYDKFMKSLPLAPYVLQLSLLIYPRVEIKRFLKECWPENDDCNYNDFKKIPGNINYKKKLWNLYKSLNQMDKLDYDRNTRFYSYLVPYNFAKVFNIFESNAIKKFMKLCWTSFKGLLNDAKYDREKIELPCKEQDIPAISSDFLDRYVGFENFRSAIYKRYECTMLSLPCPGKYSLII